jgi:hypothetical protein
MQISRPPARRTPRLPALLLALLLGVFAMPAAAHAQPGGHDHAEHGARRHTPKAKNHHPAARPGVTGAKVLSGRAVPSRAREPYTIAARIPTVLDALYCHCDCHERDDKRSLLACFEDDMATTCGICQGQARMAGELHAEGKSLAEIRAAIDRRWGS